MNSLQDITYDFLLSNLSSDVIEKLQEKALERKRRDICIVSGTSEGSHSNLCFLHEFKNATKTELPFLMKDFPNDETYEICDGSLFNLLILKREDELKGNKMFKSVLEYEYQMRFIPALTCKVPPELITELYTIILSYKDLIDDINEVFDGYFTVCFKDEETWKLVNKIE